MLVLNRSAIVVKPKEPFLDWLHAADPSSRDLTLLELVREPTIYLIPECDTDDDVADVLHELCEESFEEHRAGCIRIHQLGREIGVSISFATGLISNTLPCWLIFATNRSLSSETVMCLATQQSRDLVLANDKAPRLISPIADRVGNGHSSAGRAQTLSYSAFWRSSTRRDACLR